MIARRCLILLEKFFSSFWFWLLLMVGAVLLVKLAAHVPKSGGCFIISTG
ncbi:MAG: hypothetical protein HY318_03765 [Armatimonadetes bacterium]|nr:hypothetical protein [Armatimonadota bacterium]